jgi:very-short-patch-repair endonuclease
MNSLRHDMQVNGFLVRSSRLRLLGHSRREIDAAVAEGWLTRPVRPWVATTSAERDAVIAAMHRGRLTSASALGSMGVWRGLDRSIHVLVSPRGTGGVSRSAVPLANFDQPRHTTHGVTRHWGVERLPSALDWRVSAVDALAAFARGTTPEHFIAAVDSGLHTGVLRPGDVPLLEALLPLRMKALLRKVDGRAESGTESIARLRLAALGRSIEIQVQIGHYRVDLLIDGWLVIEIDSEEWHSSTRVEDLTKSAWLTARGYRVEHFDYSQVMTAWPTVEEAIRRALGQPQPAPRSAPR